MPCHGNVFIYSKIAGYHIYDTTETALWLFFQHSCGNDFQIKSSSNAAYISICNTKRCLCFTCPFCSVQLPVRRCSRAGCQSEIKSVCSSHHIYLEWCSKTVGVDRSLVCHPSYITATAAAVAYPSQKSSGDSQVSAIWDFFCFRQFWFWHWAYLFGVMRCQHELRHCKIEGSGGWKQ